MAGWTDGYFGKATLRRRIFRRVSLLGRLSSSASIRWSIWWRHPDNLRVFCYRRWNQIGVHRITM